MYSISNNRFTGIAQQNFRMFRDLCGDKTLKNVVLVTNMWDEVSLNDGVAREEELSSRFFKPALDKGAQMARHLRTALSAHDIIRRIVKNHPVALRIQEELVDEHKDIDATAAGEAIKRELKEQATRHEAKLKELQEEMEQAIKRKDEETRKELEEQKKEVKEQMEKVKKDSEEMALKYAAEKERFETKVRELESRIFSILGPIPMNK
jgi:DNA repair exonuclease SbcCD ATPase subunit